MEWRCWTRTERCHQTTSLFEEAVLFYNPAKSTVNEEDYLTVIPYLPKKGFSREFLNYFALFLKDTSEVGLDALMDFWKTQKQRSLSWNGTKKYLKKEKSAWKRGSFILIRDTRRYDMEIEISDFTGCKIALFCGDKLLTILRDDKSNIPYPNTWELPGGGREGDESPFECAAREVYEELGIHLTEDCLLWSKVYPSMLLREGIRLSSW